MNELLRTVFEGCLVLIGLFWIGVYFCRSQKARNVITNKNYLFDACLYAGMVITLLGGVSYFDITHRLIILTIGISILGITIDKLTTFNKVAIRIIVCMAIFSYLVVFVAKTEARVSNIEKYLHYHPDLQQKRNDTEHER